MRPAPASPAPQPASAAARGLLWVTGVFAAWRIALWAAALVSVWYNQALLPYAARLSWNGSRIERDVAVWHALVAGWSVWDGDYYRAIAAGGYTFREATWPSIPFFPLYPALIRLALPLCGGSAEIAALVVATLAAYLAVLLLYALVAGDFGEPVARRTVLCLLLFPTSMFLAAGYSESLALLLLVLAVWAMRRQAWWLAGAAGFFLALARLPGVLMAPAIAWAYVARQGWRWRRVRWPLLAALGPICGLAAFMLYQWRRFGTPLAFLMAQSQWEQRLSPPWVIPLTLIERLASEPLAIYGLHLAIWALFLAPAAVALRRLPREYGLALVVLLPAYLSSWAFSIGRHVLIGFPAFVVLALWCERGWVRWLLLALWLPLLLLCAALFVNTFWVA